MIRALLYLRLTSLKNQVIGRVKRLRQPKYFFGAIMGIAYFWLIFFRPHAAAMRHAMSESGDPALPGAAGMSMMPAVGSVLLFLLVVLTWVLPTNRPALGFTEAETAFLFPAPLSRRMLINFKLLRSQFSILFTSLFFAVLSHRWRSTGNWLTYSLGWWVILSTVNLHFTGAALTLTRLIENGLSTARRRAIVLGAIALVVIATVAWVWRDLEAPTAEDVAGIDPLKHYLLTVLEGGALGWLLWPFRLVVAPFFAASTTAFLLAAGPALLLLAAHYFWVMRMEEVSFEEASLAFAEKRTATLARARSGNYRLGAAKAKARRSPFRLADTGWPEIAFLWKNLLSTRPYFNLRTFGIFAAIIVVGSRWLHRDEELSAGLNLLIPGVGLALGVYVMLFGPQLARQDLRSDLGHADILKTYPIRGWRLVLGELLTPVAILTGLIWLLLLLAIVGFDPQDLKADSMTLQLRITCAICAGLVAPLLVALQLLVLNGATLIFPGWFQNMRNFGGGIEVMGQRLIFSLGNLLVIVVALLPAAIAGGLLIFITQHLIGLVPAVILATVIVLAVLVGELWCGLWLLGERFEKFDLSAELRP